MELNEVGKISEVSSSTDHRDRLQAQKLCSLHLMNGWVLLAVHQRGYSDGDERLSLTVYIFGHRNLEAEIPSLRITIENGPEDLAVLEAMKHRFDNPPDRWGTP